jgi:hypothetical protein
VPGSATLHCDLRPVRRILVLLGSSLSLAAYAQSTPQQEWSSDVQRMQERETNAINVSIDRGTPEGQIYFSAAQTQTEAKKVFACVQNKHAEQQRRR